MHKELCVLCDNESRQELLLCEDCVDKYNFSKVDKIDYQEGRLQFANVRETLELIHFLEQDKTKKILNVLKENK